MWGKVLILIVLLPDVALGLTASADVPEDKDVSTEDSREPEVMGSCEPVQALVGEDAILPCQVRPRLDVSGLTVEWKLNTTLAHVYRNRRDDPNLQHKDFRDRTSLFHGEMTRGNLSLKLSAVNKSDAGNYTCFVPKLDGEVKRGYAVLIVDDTDTKPKNKVHSTSTEVPEEKDVSTEDSSHKVGIGVGLGVGFFGIIIIVTVTVGHQMHRNSRNRRERRGETESSQKDSAVELNHLNDADDRA